MSKIVMQGKDGRGNRVRIHRHDDYAQTRYSVSYTDEDGQRLFTTLMDRAAADWKYHEVLMSVMPVRSKPLTELVLPEHYSIIVDADGRWRRWQV